MSKLIIHLKNQLKNQLKDFFNKTKYAISGFFLVFLVLWCILFTKESFQTNIFQVFKLFIFFCLPSIFLMFVLFSEEDSIFIVLTGFCAGLLINSFLYFLFGVFRIGLSASIYIAPLLIILICILILTFHKEKKA